MLWSPHCTFVSHSFQFRGSWSRQSFALVRTRNFSSNPLLYHDRDLYFSRVVMVSLVLVFQFLVDHSATTNPASSCAKDRHSVAAAIHNSFVKNMDLQRENPVKGYLFGQSYVLEIRLCIPTINDTVTFEHERRFKNQKTIDPRGVILGSGSQFLDVLSRWSFEVFEGVDSSHAHITPFLSFAQHIRFCKTSCLFQHIC